jgi:hypothetical protein
LAKAAPKRLGVQARQEKANQVFHAALERLGVRKGKDAARKARSRFLRDNPGIFAYNRAGTEEGVLAWEIDNAVSDPAKVYDRMVDLLIGSVMTGDDGEPLPGAPRAGGWLSRFDWQEQVRQIATETDPEVLELVQKRWGHKRVWRCTLAQADTILYRVWNDLPVDDTPASCEARRIRDNFTWPPDPERARALLGRTRLHLFKAKCPEISSPARDGYTHACRELLGLFPSPRRAR